MEELHVNLKYPIPNFKIYCHHLSVPFAGDRFAWLRDNEFARQAIAGVNPVNIELLKVVLGQFMIQVLNANCHLES